MSTSSQLPLLPSVRKRLENKSSFDDKVNIVDEHSDDGAHSDDGVKTTSNDHELRTQEHNTNTQENDERSRSKVDATPLEELKTKYEIDRKARTECIEHIIKSKFGSSSLSLSNPTQNSQMHQQRLPSSKAVPPILDFVTTTTDFMNRISVEANDKLMACSERMDRIDRELKMINDRLNSVQIQGEMGVSNK